MGIRIQHMYPRHRYKQQNTQTPGCILTTSKAFFFNFLSLCTVVCLCYMFLGESDSGKTYTFAGGNSSDEGIVPLLFEHVFKVVSEGATTVFVCLFVYSSAYIPMRITLISCRLLS